MSKVGIGGGVVDPHELVSWVKKIVGLRGPTSFSLRISFTIQTSWMGSHGVPGDGI